MFDKWQENVPGCFGAVDQIFAGHPSDADRAKELRKKLKAEGVSYDDFEKEIIWYLYKKGYDRAHIDDQLKTVAKMFKGKLV